MVSAPLPASTGLHLSRIANWMSITDLQGGPIFEQSDSRGRRARARGWDFGNWGTLFMFMGKIPWISCIPDFGVHAKRVGS